VNGLLLASLICTADLGSPVPALEARVTALEQRVAALEQPRQAATVRPAVPVAPAQPRAVVVPQGMHAHVTVDGRTIIHGDHLNGNAAAHAGVPHPWHKSAVAGQTVYLTPGTQGVTASAQYYGQSACPGGVCPQQSSRFQPFGGRFRR
jgi:hypothetical protein